MARAVPWSPSPCSSSACCRAALTGSKAKSADVRTEPGLAKCRHVLNLHALPGIASRRVAPLWSMPAHPCLCCARVLMSVSCSGVVSEKAWGEIISPSTAKHMHLLPSRHLQCSYANARTSHHKSPRHILLGAPPPEATPCRLSLSAGREAQNGVCWFCRQAGISTLALTGLARLRHSMSLSLVGRLSIP